MFDEVALAIMVISTIAVIVFANTGPRYMLWVALAGVAVPGLCMWIKNMAFVEEDWVKNEYSRMRV